MEQEYNINRAIEAAENEGMIGSKAVKREQPANPVGKTLTNQEVNTSLTQGEVVLLKNPVPTI